jgi:hypothetical protein
MNQFTSQETSVKVFKYADDTTMISLITDNNETQYHCEVARTVTQCKDNDLMLNASKTTEIAIDYRRRKNLKAPVIFTDQPITLTDYLKLVGTYINDLLKWDINSNHIIKKAQQRLYFLRQLKKYKVKQQLLVQFYTTIIQSILTSSITVWYGNTDSHSEKRVDFMGC